MLQCIMFHFSGVHQTLNSSCLGQNDPKTPLTATTAKVSQLSSCKSLCPSRNYLAKEECFEVSKVERSSPSSIAGATRDAADGMSFGCGDFVFLKLFLNLPQLVDEHPNQSLPSSQEFQTSRYTSEIKRTSF